MTRHRSLLTLGVLMAALLLVAAACGDDATATPAPTSPPAAGIDTQELQDIISAAIKAAVPAAPEVVTAAQIQSMVETAVAAAAPEGASPAEIQALVETAVAAAAGEGLTAEDVAALVSSAVADAISDQPEPLTAAEIEAIVKAAQPATPTPAPTPTPQPTATPVPIPTQAPKGLASNRLRVAADIQVETNDPHATHLSDSMPSQYLIFDYLIRLNESHGFDPMLAESWEWSADLTTWTLHLNQGVQFHNGWGEFTAADVRHSFERVARPEGAVYHDALFIEQVLPNMETPDDYTVIINLDAAKLDMDENLSSRWFAAILSKAQFDAEGQAGFEEDPAGTGPYELVEWSPGAFKLFDRVENHYRKTPDFPELQMFFASEPATRMAMLLTREIHMAQLPPDLERTAVQSGMRVIFAETAVNNLYVTFGGLFREEIPEGSTRKGTSPDLPYSDVFHPATELPWVNKKVRQALSMAINREEILATVLGGNGELMMVSKYHPSLRGWNPEWETRFPEMYGYNPERARELLAEAEAEIGAPLDWSCCVMPIFSKAELAALPDVTEAINNYWRAVGVDIPIQQIEWGAFIGNFFVSTIGGVAIVNADNRYEDPVILLINYYSKNRICCHLYENPEVDAIFEALGPTQDFDIRDDLLRQAGDIIFDDFGAVPLYWIASTATVDPRVVEEYPSTMTAGLRDLEYVEAVIE